MRCLSYNSTYWFIRKAAGYYDKSCLCAWCMGNAHLIDGRPQSEVQVRPDKLEVVASFCYLGDMLSAGGGCEITVTTHVKSPGRSSGSYYPWPCIQLSRAECHAPCQRNWASYQDEHAALATQ